MDVLLCRCHGKLLGIRNSLHVCAVCASGMFTAYISIWGSGHSHLNSWMCECMNVVTSFPITHLWSSQQYILIGRIYFHANTGKCDFQSMQWPHMVLLVTCQMVVNLIFEIFTSCVALLCFRGVEEWRHWRAQLIMPQRHTDYLHYGL